MTAETYATCCIIISHQTCLGTQKFHEKEVSSPDESRRDPTCQLLPNRCHFLTCCHQGSSSPIPVAARSRAWVCGRSLDGIAGSNPAGDMVVSWNCCVFSDRGVSQSSGGVSGCDFVTSTMSRSRPTKAVEPQFFFSAANEKQSLGQKNSPDTNTATVGSLVTKLCAM